METAIHLERASIAQWLLLWEVFEAISGMDRCRPISDVVAWKEALDAAATSLNHSTFRHSLRANTREAAVADALRTLSRKGYTIRVDGQGGRLTSRGYEQVCARIEKKIKNVGGAYAANALLSLMQQVGRVHDGSLLHARTPTMLDERSKSGTPWHYIYTLALKHFDAPPTKVNPQSVLQAMEDLTRSMAAALDVEPHSSFENMSISGASVSGVLYDSVIYDELFAFPQWQPAAAESLLPMWLSALHEEGCKFPFVPETTWSTLADRLLTRSRPSMLVSIKPLDLTSTALSPAEASRLLELIGASAEQLNSGYRTPSDNAKRTSTLYPAIRTKPNEYALQPTGIAARAFCERLYSLMRDEADDDLENRMGRALERLTAKTLEKFGASPTIVNGIYDGEKRSEHFEVDIAVETPDRIFLIECTKKPLTTAARGGSTLHVLNDLEGSFLKLLQQVARHEAVLRTKGEIVFRDGQVLRLNGRPVEKICVSLFDHGSLQDRSFTISLIERLAGTQLSADHPNAASSIIRMNKRLKRLNASLNSIIDASSDAPDRALFRFAMSTWWLSIDQLYYLCHKGDGLWNGLERVRHLTSRSGDLIYEVRRVSNLNQVGQALFEVTRSMDSRAMLEH
ncbi:hypothetical protein VB618_11065 [Microvirga sp. CF3062]|uniref:hypothetical protein n=1 Tax=Microvirga sp. CF3062 TaxID=3110182 RepID=UPI002E788E46|nr:hypothetical protein [Microvirga sp. CF3062]MEE1656739.1 hypothetical protein [Microvirga sp. CF3062]